MGKKLQCQSKLRNHCCQADIDLRFFLWPLTFILTPVFCHATVYSRVYEYNYVLCVKHKRYGENLVNLTSHAHKTSENIILILRINQVTKCVGVYEFLALRKLRSCMGP